MTEEEEQDVTVWNVRGVPRDLSQRLKIAAAEEGRPMQDIIIELVDQWVKGRKGKRGDRG